MECKIGSGMLVPRGISVLQMLLLILLLLLSHKSAGAAAAEEKPKPKPKGVSFIFGDSLSDVGNNNYLSGALAKANFPWYGVDYGNGIPTGRFSNGRTVSDIIAEKMGLPVPHAYLSPSTDAEAALRNGVNYASGGGGILDETGWHLAQRLSLNRQIALFEGTKANITKKLGQEVADEFFAESLYLIAIGSNDYINNFLLPVNGDAWQYSPEQFIGYLMSTLKQQLTTLHRLGARKVLFYGLGPLGCIPLQRLLSKDGSCREGVNDWAVQFNDAAKNVIDGINSGLPGSRFRFADSYSLIANLIQNPGAYGFAVSDAPCCTSTGMYRRPTLACHPAAQLCLDRSKYVFWDEYHPTDAANAILAESFLSDLKRQLALNSTDRHPAASAPAPL